VVIIGRGHELVRRIAVSPRHPSCGIVAIDLRCVTAAIHPSFRADRLDYPKALTDVGLREISVRRGKVRYLSLIPAAVVGTGRLRGDSDWYLDPLERLGSLPACSTSKDRKRILLAGVLVGRKGIIDLAQAVVQLPSATRSQVEVVYAGERHAEGHQELADAVALLERENVAVRTLPRKSAADEFAALLATADVIALPYRSHKGGSGLLGTGLVSSTAQLVVSDFGWTGEIAGRLDVITFPNGDIGALSEALVEALEKGNRSRPVDPEELSEFYGTDQSFGEHVWRLVDQVT
jgi:glycosyltransferase involved in cell wall biosynthesis